MHLIFSYASSKNVSLLEIFNALKINDLIAAVLWLVGETQIYEGVSLCLCSSYAILSSIRHQLYLTQRREELFFRDVLVQK